MTKTIAAIATEAASGSIGSKLSDKVILLKMQNLLPLQKQELQQSFVVWHMVYQNISNLLGKASEISDRFAARDLVEVNDGR